MWKLLIGSKEGCLGVIEFQMKGENRDSTVRLEEN